MIYLVLFIILIVIVIAAGNRPIIPASHWSHYFDNMQFSSQDFYKSVEEACAKHEIPNLTFSRVTHSQGGIFSAGREYLRATYNEYVFDICAAPFGKDFFVSWWLREKEEDLLSKIPILNSLLGKNRKQKTFYQMDTEGMFKGSIHHSVLEAIDHLTSTKGIRALSEFERNPRDSK